MHDDVDRLAGPERNWLLAVMITLLSTTWMLEPRKPVSLGIEYRRKCLPPSRVAVKETVP